MKNFLLSGIALLFTTITFAQTAINKEIELFAARTGAIPTIDKATNSLSFLRFPAGKDFEVQGGSLEQKSLNFLNMQGKLLGLRPNRDTYRFKEEKEDIYGLKHVTVQQTYQGVPVFDGVMKFHYNKSQRITALNGNYISEIKVNPVPTLSQQDAEKRAVKFVRNSKLKAPGRELRASKSALYIFQKGLAQGYNGAKHLVYEVEVRNDADVREFLYIDAHSGELVEQFAGMHQAVNRELYEGSFGNRIWKEGDPLAAAPGGNLDKWQHSEIKTAGHIYNLMKNSFKRNSFDGFDAKMITLNNDPTIGCPNANWDGVSANFCSGIAADDIVAHEWAHAYTEYTSGLVYAYQSGALNEAYSDIWGETVDQLNAYFDTGESNAVRGAGCGGSARWRLGEASTDGTFRDMWSPTCYGNAGKVSDPEYYCSTTDGGGVHSNSGVVNHAYALLVDGGTYNGKTIKGLGLTKAAHIFWYAQANYMTSTTDFAAQADILEASIADLIALKSNLPKLSTGDAAPGLSGIVLSSADAVELRKVIDAVELRRDVGCGFKQIFQPVAALCDGAKPNLAIFNENFENGLGLFATSYETASDSWEKRSWIQTTAPGGRTGKVAYGINYPGGNCTTSDQAGTIRLESPVINIPAATMGNLNMVFDHYIATERGWDGGNVWYSINKGVWTLLPASAFTANGYNGFLNSEAAGNTNPKEGEPAFTGTNEGTFEGSWGQSQIDLTSIGLRAGGNIKFRWEMGTDGCSGLDGWYVDDIRVYSCAVTPAVHFAVDAEMVNEGEATSVGSNCLNYIDKKIAVRIDRAPSKPVTITFKTPKGTAALGENADYIIFPSTLTFQTGTLSQTVTVRIFDDAYVEGDETIELSYTVNGNGGTGYAGTTYQTCKLTITDNDLAPGNFTEVLSNSGFNRGSAGWVVRNGGNTANTWVLSEYSDAYLDPAGTPFFFAYSGNTGPSVLMDEILESPAINTFNKKNMVLTYSQGWEPYVGDFPEQGMVDVWDGNKWNNVLTLTEESDVQGTIFGAPKTQVIRIPDSYANVNMKIRFHYVANWDFYWGIDNVKLTSTNSIDIASSVNTGSAGSQYLGPNETAVFYDEITGNLMAKIKNLSAHDYGCTIVEVDRAGANETAWLDGYKVTNKTFKVTPEKNNAKGNYEITLYYKAWELSSFNASKIKSMGKSEGGIASGSSAVTSFAQVQSGVALQNDYAYTATFNTGFSGFGLSDAPPSGALPVTLAKFEGKHTPEGNLLTWTTTGEVNNDHFVMERTINGLDYVELGKVAGVGNSAMMNNYEFLDDKYPKGISYYRLKQVDQDGQFEHSRIISIDAINTRELKFFPNPVQSELTMELPDPDLTAVNVRVINSAGKEIILRKNVKISKGNFSMNLGDLPTGIYQVLISGEKAKYRLSVLKQ